ncbi:MAG: ion channel [Gemmatimonadaceae bacterium]
MNTEHFGALKRPPLGEGADRHGDDARDLGLGTDGRLSGHHRLLNTDGTFNVRRRGLGWSQENTLYHAALTLSWPKFFGVLTVAYFWFNLFFGTIFWLWGDSAIEGTSGLPGGRFLSDFFFSVQTFATIGYGQIVPHGLLANITVTFEALAGVLYQALAAGLFIARLTRPRAAIVFSQTAVVTGFREGLGLMLRLTNTRRSELIDLHAQAVLSRVVPRDGALVRRYEPLVLDREQVNFMPVAWTIVHPINKESPLWGATSASLAAEMAEVLVLCSGVDETHAQTVHARKSYKGPEIMFGHRFMSMFTHEGESDRLIVDVRKVHATEPVK